MNHATAIGHINPKGRLWLTQAASDEDWRDINGSLDGNEAAFERLVKRYEGLIGAQMWRFTRDRTQWEELVQEAFVESYLSLKSFKGKAPFIHWLRRIATRTGYRFWKQQAREKNRRAKIEEMDFQGSVEDQTPSEAAETLHNLLAEMAPKDRLVLTLMYFDDLNVQEIVQRTGWTRSLVKVRAYRARKKMKTMMEEAGFGGG